MYVYLYLYVSILVCMCMIVYLCVWPSSAYSLVVTRSLFVPHAQEYVSTSICITKGMCSILLLRLRSHGNVEAH